MKAAALGHHYLTVKSISGSDSLFRGSRYRSLQKHQLQNAPPDRNQLITPASEPLSRRATIVDETSIPSVSVITRSLSDSGAPHAVYQNETPIKGEYQ
jgi:hypothetical protein